MGNDNLLHLLMNREVRSHRPGTAINRVRHYYERLTPKFSVHNIRCPDFYIRKFVNDGQLLICLSNCQQEVIVYRYTGLSYCTPGEGKPPQSVADLPEKAKTFEGYFRQLYVRRLSMNPELMCKDFCVVIHEGKYAVLASSTRAEHGENESAQRNVSTLPVMESMTLHLLRLSDGEVCDRLVFENDLMHLSHNTAVSVYNNMLVLLSIRHQCIRIIGVSKLGLFKKLRELGPYCHEDDELTLMQAAKVEAEHQAEKLG
eukprot:CAMPEP_0118948938 /NCGR_PEP_ID=MMETSP1169-20130426/48710_1 /TAXON_ID=36882 /ORGANISM="Pyramimonas obovata, Strain CCMP722" /LENGTH=257 /DNA_ID=CAMNT_0006895465 /DNA_START=272 /DNA_END=1041 /DNA_ORIENTATION=-